MYKTLLGQSQREAVHCNPCLISQHLAHDDLDQIRSKLLTILFCIEAIQK